MNATFKTSHPGNLAIETQVWTIPTEIAKKVVASMKADGMLTPGAYWTDVIAKPTRKAVRAKVDAVKVYTGGFSTGNLSNYIFACGFEVENAGIM